MKNKQRGQTIIELIIAMGLSAIFLPALLTGLVASREGKPQQQQRLSATAYVKETQEALRIIRENNWSAVATNGTYHPQISGGTWTLAAGSDTVNGFTRSVVISDVYRDANGNIVGNGGTIDPATKKAVTTLSWNTPLASSVSSTQYLTRFLGNTTFVQTTSADFNAGTLNGTAVTNTAGGEVTLGAGGHGDWCKPNLSIPPLDLPGQGITTAISAVSGHAFTTTGGNSSGDSMTSINISDPPYPTPPSATNAGEYDNYKTYGIFTDGSYAYLTSDHPNLTVDIVEVTSQPYTQVGTFNNLAHTAGISVYVVGNVGYVTAGNALYTFDLTSKSGSRPLLGNIQLAGNGNRVMVVGNYAYVATNSTTSQLQIINVTSPTNMSITASFNLGNNSAGVDLSVNNLGTRVYIATSYPTNPTPTAVPTSTPVNPDLFIVDTTNITSPKILSSYTTNGMNPKGVTVVAGNKVIIVGSGGEQYQVVDVTNISAPTHCGGLTSPNGATSINAISSVYEADGDAYSYILTNTASQEFQIIEGGPGGPSVTSGTFESATMASPSASNPNQINLNRFDANVAQPANTGIKIQVGSTNAVSGSCSGASFSYVGPDNTINTYYTSSNNSTISGIFPSSLSGNYLNPAFCYRYKAYLSTTDTSAAPILYDITTNFSP